MHQDEGSPADERKIVSVLFADLVGSTALGDEEDPERTRRLLDRFYDLTTDVIDAAGGTIEKFVGDAVMAVFGSPVAQEDHAERALHAALGIRDRLAVDLGTTIEVRIGVNSGEAFVASPRAGSSFVSGDTVNVAARLEQGAAPSQILVGERTFDAVGGAFELGPATPMEAKGKRGPVVARELIRAVEHRRPRGIASRGPGGPGPRDSTFVGRVPELDQLQAAWSLVAATGRPHLVTIIGEPGIGKTSIVSQLLGRLDRVTPPVPRHIGRCLAYGRGSTFWPLAEILREYVGLGRMAHADEALGRLRGREILGLTLGLDVAGDLHPLAARERLHDAWVGLIEEMSAAGPLVIVIEDVHWAETPLLDLLAELVREAHAPLMLVVTARPEFADERSGWSGRNESTTVWLEPLSSMEAGSMVDRLLGAPWPPALEGLVIDRADGNPFFVEELLSSLLDRDLLVELDGAWRLDEAAAAAMPDSVRAVIAARVDLLGPTEKAALQAASVAGRTFSSAAVIDLLDGREPDFGLLEDRRFVRRSGIGPAGEREYAFKHALIRDVAYASVPRRQRAHLHAAVAERLERISESGDQFAFLLAHHFFEAVRPEYADLAWSAEPQRLAALTERAVEWLRRAGELAAARFAIDDGLALLDQALGLDPPPATAALIWRTIGRVHAIRYGGVEAVTAYRTAVEKTDDPALQAEIYAELSLEVVQRYAMFNPMLPRDLVEDWVERSLALAGPDTPARARALVARALWSPQSEQAAQEAVEIAERAGDVDLLSHAYNSEAYAAFVVRRYDESRAWAERRLALADRISDPDHRVDIVSAVIPGLLGLGRFDEARRYADLHDEAASRLSTHHQVHAVAMKLELEELAGEWEVMRGLGPRTRHVVEANVDTPCVRNARSLLACAVAEAFGGNDGPSQEFEARARELEMAGYRGTFAPLRIRLALARGDLSELDELVAAATPPPPAKNWWALNTESARLDALAALGDRAAVEAEAPTFLVPGTYLEPFALRALGLVRGDTELLGGAIARFEALGLGWFAADTKRLLAA